MKKGAKCSDCDGELDMTKEIPLRTSCTSYASAIPCSKCGRLHWDDKNPVSNRSGERAFLVDGKIDLRPEEKIRKPEENN